MKVNANNLISFTRMSQRKYLLMACFGCVWSTMVIVTPSSRDHVGEVLLFESFFVNAGDIYSFIALPNRQDFEPAKHPRDICFRFKHPKQLSLNGKTRPQKHLSRWRLPLLVVKFWTSWVPDEDSEQNLTITIPVFLLWWPSSPKVKHHSRSLKGRDMLSLCQIKVWNVSTWNHQLSYSCFLTLWLYSQTLRLTWDELS